MDTRIAEVTKIGDKTPSTKAQEQTAASQTALAQDQQKKSDQLFELSFPGVQKASDYYTKLSTGDPSEIQRAIAPGVQQITNARDQAKKNIMSQTPRGGEQNLALSEADINAASAIGGAGLQAYESSFPALASLGQGGLGISINEVANALAGFSGASHTEANIANQQAAGKAATLGFWGSLAGAGAELGSAGMSHGA